MAGPPTGILFNDPRDKPLSTTGLFQAGCYRYFYLTQTTTQTPVYQDGLLTTPLTQPITAASDGRFPQIYLNPATIYRCQLYSATNVLLDDTDPYVTPTASVTAAQVGQLIFPQTTAENVAGITPTNYSFAPGVIDRYGTNTTPGVTDMTGAVVSACAQAMQSGGSPVQGASTYLTSSSIPNLHLAPKVKSPAILTRGGTNFYLWPTDSQVNTLNVSTSGNDANDGLGTGQSFATIQAAVTAHTNYSGALVTNGVPKVKLAAGTWTLPSVTVPAGFQSANYLQILGASGTLPFTPTSIIDGTGAAPLAFAFAINGNNTVLFQDLLIQNFSNAGGCFGINAQEFSEVLLNSNVQFSSVDNAVKLQQGRLYIGQACIITGGVVGVTCISGVTYTIGYNCNTTAINANKGNANVGLYISGTSQSGALIQENATGHFDYSGANNCAVGLDVVCSSRANCNFSQITNNATAGLRLRMDSSWNDNGTSALFSGNGTNELKYSYCSEFARQGTFPSIQAQPFDTVAATALTGSTTLTVLKTYSNWLPAGYFTDTTKTISIRGAGKITGTAGTKTIQLATSLGTLGTFVIPATWGGTAIPFEFEFMLLARSSANSQDYHGKLWVDQSATTGGVLVINGSLSLGFAAGAVQTLTISGQLGNSGDTLALNMVEPGWETG